MFILFFALLSFSNSLAFDRAQRLFLNDESCMVRLTLIDMKPTELKYYPSVISIDKSTGSCNVLSQKICIIYLCVCVCVCACVCVCVC